MIAIHAQDAKTLYLSVILIRRDDTWAVPECSMGAQVKLTLTHKSKVTALYAVFWDITTPV